MKRVTVTLLWGQSWERVFQDCPHGKIRKFKPIQQSGKLVLRACCPNIYTVNERESKGHILLTFVREQWAMNQPKNLTNLHFDRI